MTTRFDDLLATEDEPVIVADENGVITRVNELFLKTFRWAEEDLVGELLTVIMPAHFRDAHSMGFSRFTVTKTRTLPEHAIHLEVVCGDGSSLLSEHTILAGQRGSSWIFVGRIVPLNEA